MSPEVASILRVFFWSGALALACWLAMMGLEAVPSFREANRPRPGDEPEPKGIEPIDSAAGH